MRKRVAAFGVALVAICGFASSAHAAPLVVQDIDHGTTTQSMAQSLVGNGVTISNVSYTGTQNAGGAFPEGPA